MAVCETILHDVDRREYEITTGVFINRILVRLHTRRSLELARFQGTGLTRLKIKDTDLTNTSAGRYPETVPWAAAAHAAGFDGCVWTSRQFNGQSGYVVFGDRIRPDELVVDAGYGRIFASGEDRDWIIDFCTRIGVEVLVP